MIQLADVTILDCFGQSPRNDVKRQACPLTFPITFIFDMMPTASHCKS